MDSSTAININSFKQENVDFEKFEENYQVENDVEVKEEIFDSEEITESANAFIKEEMEDLNNEDCNKNLGTELQNSEPIGSRGLLGGFIAATINGSNGRLIRPRKLGLMRGRPL